MEITDHFKGVFVTEPLQLQQRLLHIKAYVFDWDGVFNDGMKDEHGSSPFSEVDAMGTNLLRFNHYLTHQATPVFAIVSGEHNKAAISLAKRESFHAVYGGIRYKAQALDHLCQAHDIHPAEVAFVFDDVLDFSLAEKCGVRIMVPRACNPLLVEYAVQNNLVDYLTANEGGQGAVREAVELICGLGERYNELVTHRMHFTDTYQAYLALRNQTTPSFLGVKDGRIGNIEL